MTRFARAEGSKADNKKTPEDSTPWEVMKAQIEKVKKQRKEEKLDKYISDKNLSENAIQSQDLTNISAECEVNYSEMKNENNQEIKGTVNDNSNGKVKENEISDTNSTSKRSKKNKNKKKNLSFEQQKKNYIIEDGNKYKVFKNGVKKPWLDLPYEENEIMTRYKSFYIKREMVPVLNNLRKSLEEEGLGEKEINKKVFRKEERAHNKLRVELLRQQIQENKLKNGDNSVVKPQTKVKSNKKENKKSNNEGNKGHKNKEDNPSKKENNFNTDLVRFDGFMIKKEAAGRLKTLRVKLRNKGIDEEEVKSIMQRERRKEEKVLKREKAIFCFRCRLWGHLVSSCPKLSEGRVNDDVQICYKCGSAEHMARSCTAKKGNSYSHATCFVCGEMGHISKECPDNPKGLYPNGGGCKECGSVEHFKRDCPDLQKLRDQNTITLPTFHRGEEVEAMDADYSNPKEHPNHESKKKSKIIKF